MSSKQAIPLPPDFVRRVSSDPFLGTLLLEALETIAPASLRRNPRKAEAQLPESRPIPWSENGLFLSERPSYTLDPLFHAGCYYPQEAGSQLLDTVLRQLDLPESPVILDLCAAPGGKSTLIAAFLDGKGLLVSNEVIHARSKILKENLIKWGVSNSVVTNNDPADFNRVPQLFDCVVIDAPCSGEGMFRKDPAARNEWSQANVDLCSARQRRIVMDAWDCLKPGGYLVYSTCTFNTQENEENVSWFARELAADIEQIEIPFAKADRENTGWYALPGELDTEGFYIAVLRKPEDRLQRTKAPKNKKISIVKDPSAFRDFAKLDAHAVLQWTDFVFAVPEDFRDIILLLHDELRVIKVGTELGELSRKGLLPNEALALDPVLRNDQLPRIELTRDQALSYLHGDTFLIDGKHGFQLMTYRNEPLGWIKHLGNRFNNLYPKEWRIRMNVK